MIFFWFRLQKKETNLLLKKKLYHMPCECKVRFSHLDRSLNRKRERFKVFEVEPRSNRDDIIINLIIN